MTEQVGPFALRQSVRVYPGTPDEKRGVVVEDFGDIAGLGVDVAGKQIVGPSRRWAVQLDTGELVFVDTDQLAT